MSLKDVLECYISKQNFFFCVHPSPITMKSQAWHLASTCVLLTLQMHKLPTRTNFDQLLDDLMPLIRGCLVHEWFDPQSASELLHKMAMTRDIGEGNRQSSTNRAWKHMEDVITQKLRIVLSMDLGTLQRLGKHLFWLTNCFYVLNAFCLS